MTPPDHDGKMATMAGVVRATWLAAPSDSATDTLALVGLDALDDAETWRDLARSALRRLHELHVEIGRLRQRLRDLHNARRADRAREAT